MSIADNIGLPVDYRSGLAISGPLSPSLAQPANGVNAAPGTSATTNVAPMAEAMAPLTAAPLATGGPTLRSPSEAHKPLAGSAWIVAAGLVALYVISRRR